jgi:hypothetical protein
MPTTYEQRLHQIRFDTRRCEAEGCYLNRRRWSPYCSEHEERAKHQGHPHGTGVKLSEVRPYRDKAAEYIAQHRDHPRIARTLEKIERLIYSAPNTTPVITSKSRPPERVVFWLVRLKRAGIRPDEVLAMIAGMYLLREDSPCRFEDDRHWRFQTVRRVLRLIPNKSEKRGDGHHASDRTTIRVGVYELLGDHLVQVAGPTALEIAQVLHAALRLHQPFKYPDG